MKTCGSQPKAEPTPYYQVIGRCAQRAYLCGVDASTGKDYEHRRLWVIERLELLCSVFAVELCSYTIMSNHYDLVIRLAPGTAEHWTQEEVLARWEQLYGIPSRLMNDLAPDADQAQHKLATEMIQDWREHLADLSWFVKCLNEYIASRAKLEDRCTVTVHYRPFLHESC